MSTNEVKQKFPSDDFSEIKTKQFRNQSISCLEDLSNEILCEIFDYLCGYLLYNAFSHLNFRFEQILHCPSVLFKTHFCLFESSLLMNKFKEIMNLNRHQIYSISINFLLEDSDRCFSWFSFDSSFDRLQSVSFKDIQPDTIISLLNNLSSLPKLLSLTIETSSVKEKINDIYRLIFLLPKLKYYRCSISNTHHSITLPMSMNNRFSPIEYFVINHCFSLNELTSLLSYTPQLRRLTLRKTNDSNLTILQSIPLIHLQSIFFDLCRTTFNQMEIFLTKIVSNLKRLLLFAAEDITFLDAYRWEQFLLNHFPQLDKFYLRYDDHLNNEQNYPVFTGRPNQFSSSFWIERQWLLEAGVKNNDIEYTIRPYRKRWYDNGCCENSTFTRLTFEFISDSMFEEGMSKAIERVLSIAQMYHLEIVKKKISISLLVQLVSLLPDITTLRIHSLSIDETMELTVKELLLCSMKETSQITKVYLEQMDDLQAFDFICTLCPYMEYFRVGSISTMDTQSFLRTIFKRINRKNNHHLRPLCFHLPAADDQIIGSVEEMIEREKLHTYSTAQHRLDSIYLFTVEMIRTLLVFSSKNYLFNKIKHF